MRRVDSSAFISYSFRRAHWLYSIKPDSTWSHQTKASQNIPKYPKASQSRSSLHIQLQPSERGRMPFISNRQILQRIFEGFLKERLGSPTVSPPSLRSGIGPVTFQKESRTGSPPPVKRSCNGSKASRRRVATAVTRQRHDSITQRRGLSLLIISSFTS